MKSRIKRYISICLLVCMAFSVSGIETFAKISTSKKTVLKTGIKKTVKKEIPSKKEFRLPVIEDEVAAELSKTTKCKKHEYNTEIIQDEPVVISSENKKFKRSDYKQRVRTEDGLAVVLKPVNKISTRNKRLKIGEKDVYTMAYPYIGDRVAFKVVKDVEKDGKLIIAKDTIVYAKIGEVSPRAMGGAPAEMTIEGFELYDKDGKLVPLGGEIASSGYSLSFWIGLAELATTPFLFGLAVPLLRLFPGGQAVISPKKSYVVYY